MCQQLYSGKLPVAECGAWPVILCRSNEARSFLMSWSAQQYSLFERQRTRPVHDLLAAVPRIAVPLAG